jgi:hypothetical protein
VAPAFGYFLKRWNPVTQWADTTQTIRQLPRRKRVLLVIVPLMLVGEIDIIRAYNRGNIVELIAAAVIFFVIMPLFAVWWDRFRHT